jgi:Mlc titration factor MtfA (ptsG expression regulator)/antitoxin component YwqK of YwqJK toxin-antitoxin module
MAIVSHPAPFPPGFKPKWRDILEQNVALYRRLPEDLTLVVEEMIPWFVGKVLWEWDKWVGPTPDKEMQKVCVACEACVLIARRSKKDYEHFHTFVFHQMHVTDKDGKNWGGWAEPGGTIRQSWRSTKNGMHDGVDNHNVTLHEFGHMLEYRDSDFDSVPHFDSKAARVQYKHFLEEEYADICSAWEKKTGNEIIRKYATSEKVEFFSCVTEAFFERSEMLRFMRRDLYDWMVRIYQMDPAKWPERISQAELQDERYDQWSDWMRRSTWQSKSEEMISWPDGVDAADYAGWFEQEKGRLEREKRERKEREFAEKMRREKERVTKEQREAKERERNEKEESEHKARERYLLNNRTVIVEYPNGTPQLKYKLINGQRDGLMQRWDEEGQLREETELIRGKKHGTGAYYHANGKKEMEGFFALNRRAGIWLGWHEDGSPSFRSEYREGELHTWEQFGEDGKSRTYGKVTNRFGA